VLEYPRHITDEQITDLMMKALFLITAMILLITSCGGGNSASTPITDTPTQPTQVTQAEIILIEESVGINQTAELILFSPDYDVQNITWKQTSGEAVTFFAKHSKVIAFASTSQGNFSFEVTFDNDKGLKESLSQTITISDSEHLLSARLSHAVVEENKVSLVTYIAEGIEEDSIAWQQTSGPQVTFTEASTNGKLAVFFNAPSVNADTLLTFKVTAQNEQTNYQDNIAVLVENSDANVIASNQTSPFNSRLAKVVPYNDNALYANELVDCVYANSLTYSKSCTFNKLPLLAHTSSTPTVNEVMDRVVVSHQWMGDRFKSFLENYDIHNDFKNLLRATTAIVISYDIRPSFYHPYTGAIYLDPSDLWVTPEERDTINQAPDYRGGFGSELQFEMPWRYTKDNDWASYSFPREYRITRSPEHALYDFSALLYHELAHANDFYPSSLWHNLNQASTIVAITNSSFNSNNIQSALLQNTYPLHGDEMRSLGTVRFRGEAASASEKALSPDDVAQLFEVEDAPQFYNYSTSREDYAILFDGFMMKARFNVDRDVAVSNQTYSNIFWGQRGRIGENRIKSRVKFVAARVLPEFAQASSLIEELAAPLAMRTNIDWFDSVVFDIGPSDHPPLTNTIAGQLLRTSKRLDLRLKPLNGRDRVIFEQVELR